METINQLESLDSTASVKLPSSDVRPLSQRSRHSLSWQRRTLFSLIPVVLLMFVAEVVARCCGVGSHAGGQRFEQIEQIVVYLGNTPGQSIFEPDPDCFWRLKPNVVLPREAGSLWGGMMSNRHGLRSRDVALEDTQSKRRILCFGDSTTFSFGVLFESAWPNQLQQTLESRAPNQFEILNAGVPGQTTYQGRRRLTRELAKWRPEMAFITFGNNDGWRWDDQADKDHARRSQATTEFAWVNHSAALRGLIKLSTASQRQHQTQSELEWAQKASLNYFDPNQDWTPRVSINDYIDNLRAMIDECRASDCEPVLMIWPDQRQLLHQTTWRLPYQEAMREVARESGVRSLDLVRVFERAGDWGRQRFIPNDVIHLDHAGNELVSQTVLGAMTLR